MVLTHEAVALDEEFAWLTSNPFVWKTLDQAIFSYANISTLRELQDKGCAREHLKPDSPN